MPDGQHGQYWSANKTGLSQSCWGLRKFENAHRIAAFELPVLLVPLLALACLGLFGLRLQFQRYQLTGTFFIGMLAAFGHHFHADACGDVGGVYGRIGGVHVLAATA